MMEKTEQGLGRLCVIGDPVEHSKSPLIQNAMIAKLGIPYHYTKRLVHQGDTQEWLIPPAGRASRALTPLCPTRWPWSH